MLPGSDWSEFLEEAAGNHKPASASTSHIQKRGLLSDKCGFLRTTKTQ
jgi:hypothetical protein